MSRDSIVCDATALHCSVSVGCAWLTELRLAGRLVPQIARSMEGKGNASSLTSFTTQTGRASAPQSVHKPVQLFSRCFDAFRSVTAPRTVTLSGCAKQPLT